MCHAARRGIPGRRESGGAPVKPRTAAGLRSRRFVVRLSTHAVHYDQPHCDFLFNRQPRSGNSLRARPGFSLNSSELTTLEHRCWVLVSQ